MIAQLDDAPITQALAHVFGEPVLAFPHDLYIPPEALRSKDAKTIVPPLHGALLKNEQDVHLFERLLFMSRTNR